MQVFWCILLTLTHSFLNVVISRGTGGCLAQRFLQKPPGPQWSFLYGRPVLCSAQAAAGVKSTQRLAFTAGAGRLAHTHTT